MYFVLALPPPPFEAADIILFYGCLNLCSSREGKDDWTGVGKPLTSMFCVRVCTVYVDSGKNDTH